MVDALREARRVLAPSGDLLDVRPVIAPIRVEVVAASRPIWAKTVHSYSAPEDMAAADRAVQHCILRRWFVAETSHWFDFDIYCDNAAELSAYAEARKLRGSQIPYEELEEEQRKLDREGQSTRLRCRRMWMLTSYRKR